MFWTQNLIMKMTMADLSEKHYNQFFLRISRNWKWKSYQFFSFSTFYNFCPYPFLCLFSSLIISEFTKASLMKKKPFDFPPFTIPVRKTTLSCIFHMKRSGNCPCTSKGANCKYMPSHFWCSVTRQFQLFVMFGCSFSLLCAFFSSSTSSSSSLPALGC